MASAIRSFLSGACCRSLGEYFGFFMQGYHGCCTYIKLAMICYHVAFVNLSGKPWQSLDLPSGEDREHRKLREVELGKEQTRLQTRLERLLEAYLDGDIEKEVYQSTRLQINGRIEEIAQEKQQCSERDTGFSQRLQTLVEYASGVCEVFKGSNVREKREILNLVFSNLQLRGANLDVCWAEPFSHLLKPSNIDEWYARQDSNL